MQFLASSRDQLFPDVWVFNGFLGYILVDDIKLRFVLLHTGTVFFLSVLQEQSHRLISP